MLIKRHSAPRFAPDEPPALRLDPEAESALDACCPVYFGHSDRPVFGWFHRADRSAAATVGLVICSPFGDEAIRAQRSLRHLAEGAARSGVPALRFDYDGTGDSAGHDLEPERLREWLASIRFAAQSLREWSGVERVCFAGLRLGALLAAVAACEYSATAGLAAIAPIINGRAYVRELRLLRRAIEAKRNITRTEGDGPLEAAGFLMTAQTQADLSAVNLTRLEGAPPPRVLILDRAELPLDETWAQELRTRGARVEHERLQGYAEMMLDSHETVVPEAIIGATLAWLRDVAGGQRRTLRATPADPNRRRVTLLQGTTPDPVTGTACAVPIDECALQFSTAPKLFGIVSAAQARRPETADPRAVLLLNAGAVYHIGPCRLYVALARHLAQLGYVVLRLDIRGIGDSPPRPGQPENVVYAQHAVEDIGVAIEYLRREWGVGAVHAVGLCSGAYHALKAAVAHLPLRGIVSINPLTFFWKADMSLEYPEHRVAQDIMRYRNNARSLASWRKLLSGQVHLGTVAQILLRTARSRLVTPLLAAARLLHLPLRDDLPTELLRATAAGVDLQFIFAATDPGVELLNEKGGATARRLRARGQLGVELVEHADHTFTDLAARIQLAALLEQKLSGTTGSGSA